MDLIDVLLSWATWRQLDMTMITSLLNNMEPSIAVIIMFLGTAKEAWEIFASTYAPQEIFVRFIDFMKKSLL